MKQASPKRTNTVCYEFHLHAFTSGSEEVKFTDTDEEWWLPAGGWRGGNAELGLQGQEFQMRKMKRFWRWMVLMVAQQCEWTQFN